MSGYTEPSPVAVLKDAYANHDKVTISFSGAEDVVLIDMACKIKNKIQHKSQDKVEVFTLDTGRLHPETYRFLEDVREKYDINLSVITPNQIALQKFVNKKGLFSFYEDGHQECCNVRKIEPLKGHLVNFDAWITGQRRDQSPTRQSVPQHQHDEAFSSSANQLTKYNPLAAWSSTDVWDYIRENEVPYNPLHERGYISIGCEPCTRPTTPNEHERMGRWWWEESTQRECGLHMINVRQVG